MNQSLNEIAIKVANNCGLEFNIIKNDPVEIVFGNDENGDVGISADGNELTVYGCGGHRHYLSDYDNRYSVEENIREMTEIIVGIMNCEWVCWGAFTKDNIPVCGSLCRRDKIDIGKILNDYKSDYLIVNIFNKQSYKLTNIA